MSTEQEKKKKNYLKGSAKQKDFNGSNHLINVDLLLSDLQKLPINEAGYVKITLSKYKEVDRYGNTHSIYENDFVPQAQPRTVLSEPAPANPSNLKKRATDDLPF